MQHRSAKPMQNVQPPFRAVRALNLQLSYANHGTIWSDFSRRHGVWSARLGRHFGPKSFSRCFWYSSSVILFFRCVKQLCQFGRLI